MTAPPSRLSIGLLALPLLFLSIRPAYAYIDPGTGSLIFQMAAASLLTALFMFRKAIRYLFYSLFKRGASKPDDSAPAPKSDVPNNE